MKLTIRLILKPNLLLISGADFVQAGHGTRGDGVHKGTSWQLLRI